MAQLQCWHIYKSLLAIYMFNICHFDRLGDLIGDGIFDTPEDAYVHGALLRDRDAYKLTFVNGMFELDTALGRRRYRTVPLYEHGRRSI